MKSTPSFGPSSGAVAGASTARAIGGAPSSAGATPSAPALRPIVPANLPRAFTFLPPNRRRLRARATQDAAEVRPPAGVEPGLRGSARAVAARERGRQRLLGTLREDRPAARIGRRARGERGVAFRLAARDGGIEDRLRRCPARVLGVLAFLHARDVAVDASGGRRPEGRAAPGEVPAQRAPSLGSARVGSTRRLARSAHRRALLEGRLEALQLAQDAVARTLAATEALDPRAVDANRAAVRSKPEVVVTFCRPCSELDSTEGEILVERRAVPAVLPPRPAGVDA